MKNVIKKTQTILFASLIVAMILPFSMMDTATAEKNIDNVKTNIKSKVSYDYMPTKEDVKKELKSKGHTKKQIEKMDLDTLHFDKHQKWLKENHDPVKEVLIREKQIVLTEMVIDDFQNTDESLDNYLPWTSIGYDYKDNALEITIEPKKFTDENIQKYVYIIRSIIGDEIDITISPLDAGLEQVSCWTRDTCGDLEAGVKIDIQGKFSCTLGFAATYQDNPGFVTAGHCFDGSRVGTNVYHSGAYIGDLVRETATTSTSGSRCDCAFVRSTSNFDVSDKTFGITNDADRAGTTTKNKQIKASLGGNTNDVKMGIILDVNRSFSVDEEGTNGNDYIYKYVAVTNISVKSGDSGSPVFGQNGQELLGFMVSALKGTDDNPQQRSIYVKHEKFTTYYRGLEWDF